MSFSHGSSCLESLKQQATLLPSWVNIREFVFDLLKKFVDESTDHPYKLAVLFSLCGDDFRATKCPEIPRNGHFLMEPYLTAEDREILEEDISRDVLDFISNKFAEIDFYDSTLFKTFENEVTQSIESTMEIYSFSFPAAENSPLGFHRRSNLVGSMIANLLNGTLFPTKIKSPDPHNFNEDQFIPSNQTWVFRSTVGPSQRSTDSQSEESQSPVSNDLSILFQPKLVKDKVEIAQRDEFFSQMKGRSIPRTLRQYLWASFLHNPGKQAEWREVFRLRPLPPHTQSNSAPIVVESAVSNLLSRIIHQRFQEELASYHDEKVVSTTVLKVKISSVLNQLYLAKHTYESCYVSLVIPMITLFPDFSSQDSELMEMVETFLLYFVDGSSASVNQSFNPSSSKQRDLLQVSKNIWEDLRTRNADLYDHMESVYKKELLKAKGKSIEHPTDQILKWLQVGFVGYLLEESVFFLLDQMILNADSNPFKVYELACSVVFNVLGGNLRSRRTMGSIMNVLKVAPKEIYTKKLRTKYNEMLAEV